MKSVAHSEETGSVDTIEMQMRKRAREIIRVVFAYEKPGFALIEEVTRESIHTDEDGLVESAISEETEKLIESRQWAKEAYGDDSPEATFCAYRVLYGMTDDERWEELLDKVDEVARKKK